MKKDLLLMMLALFLVVSCDDDNETPEPEPGNSVQLLDHSTLGSVLTDEAGMTLYYFSRDFQSTSTCEGGCLANWPIFYADELTLDEGLDAGDFSTITRSDGESQTTYKGWPLYYYANDASPGDVEGEGASDVWYVAKPDYSLMLVSAQLTGADGNTYVVNDTGAYVQGEGRTLYLTDELGNTLYGFINDRYDVNNFTNEDFSNDASWPIYEEDLDAIPSTLAASDFNVIDVHGRSQLTYRGWPLYYFGADESRGDNKGVSVPQPGVWPVLTLDTQDAPAE
ncbi:MAG TPA: hypothetical protein VKZ54_13115 [Membranihabitans sp.]|nr:hypothetical protein [Membranihabitans sp.]